ncbi:MAG: ADP-ribose pyrophosphatase [Candidatus Wolfebacteria bacterium GW2011_GWC2_39_22]|uniref:ADP-ribose pyrophosphatase n=1 Tax=Candidatus Wolfebacteria bacterium GW2011_GWC2_39_22 TaxID=1619013 RepID=A0A0G0N910_9BACT|nr:MAG: ADP-ribose pyrophosphatase [Candidatus Wolfebacteria bacterium GW2011_GWC2_39_22]HBI25698.1 hypothetical protein [Candidatus Wolfebacteria bacterium]
MNGAIVIFYRYRNGRQEFLLVQNAETGNIGFVGGAQEGEESLTETAQREIKEELGLRPNEYTITSTDTTHEFIFGENKPERDGERGFYQVFLSDGGLLNNIPYTEELKNIMWKSREDVLKVLSFDDLKDVFSKVIERIKDIL